MSSFNIPSKKMVKKAVTPNIQLSTNTTKLTESRDIIG